MLVSDEQIIFLTSKTYFFWHLFATIPNHRRRLTIKLYFNCHLFRSSSHVVFLEINFSSRIFFLFSLFAHFSLQQRQQKVKKWHHYRHRPYISSRLTHKWSSCCPIEKPQRVRECLPMGTNFQWIGWRMALRRSTRKGMRNKFLLFYAARVDFFIALAKK